MGFVCTAHLAIVRADCESQAHKAIAALLLFDA
jgi:hypothetical protein